MRVTNLNELNDLITAQMHRGVRTNCVLMAEQRMQAIGDGLDAVEFPGGLLLFQQRSDYYRLFFYLQAEASLPVLLLDRPAVIEIAYRDRDTGLQAAIADFEATGFQLLFHRQRRIVCNRSTIALAGVSNAHVGELEQAMAILQQSFHPLTGCLPTMQELEADIIEKRLLCAHRSGALVGLLHMGNAKHGTELRHFAVAEPFRNQGIGQLLLDGFAVSAPGKRLAWVRCGNDAAIHLYEKNDYRVDGWHSAVLLHKS